MSVPINGVGLLKLNTGELMVGDDCEEFYVAIRNGQVSNRRFISYQEAVDRYLDIVATEESGGVYAEAV